MWAPTRTNGTRVCVVGTNSITHRPTTYADLGAGAQGGGGLVFAQNIFKCKIFGVGGVAESFYNRVPDPLLRIPGSAPTKGPNIIIQISFLIISLQMYMCRKSIMGVSDFIKICYTCIRTKISAKSCNF